MTRTVIRTALLIVGLAAAGAVIPAVAHAQPAPAPPPPPPPPPPAAPPAAPPAPPAAPAPGPAKPAWAQPKPFGPAKPAQPAAPPPAAPPPQPAPPPPPPQPVAPPQPAPPPQLPPPEAPAELPFYDAQGAKVVIPPPPPPPSPPSAKPDVGLVALNLVELFDPGLSSNATMVAPLAGFHIGDFGMHLGYVNLAGQSGVDGGFDALAFGKGARLFTSGTLSGSIAFPISVSLLGFPGAIARPTFIGYVAWEPAFRIAKCFGDFSLEASLGPHVGGGLAIFNVYGLQGVAMAGGHFDIGIAFWP